MMNLNEIMLWCPVSVKLTILGGWWFFLIIIIALIDLSRPLSRESSYRDPLIPRQVFLLRTSVQVLVAASLLYLGS